MNILKLAVAILKDQIGVTLAITRVTANTLITAGATNNRADEIEAVVNALTSANFAADSVLAAALGSDVVRANYGLIQNTDGSLYVDLSDTTPALELTDGGLRLKVKAGLLSKGADGVDWGRTGDMLLSSSATTPDGFTDVSATYEGKFIRISATALSEGGANTHTHAAGTLAGPSHTHTVPAGGWSYSIVGVTGYLNVYAGGQPQADAAATSGASGTGAITGATASGDNIPAYLSLRMYSKN